MCCVCFQSCIRFVVVLLLCVCVCLVRVKKRKKETGGDLSASLSFGPTDIRSGAVHGSFGPTDIRSGAVHGSFGPTDIRSGAVHGITDRNAPSLLSFFGNRC